MSKENPYTVKTAEHHKLKVHPQITKIISRPVLNFLVQNKSDEALIRESHLPILVSKFKGARSHNTYGGMAQIK